MHNDAHSRTHHVLTAFTIPSRSTSCTNKGNRATDTREPSPQRAIPGLPDHLVVTHIIRSEYFDDPADLARLPAMSRAMRDAVAVTGLEFDELG